ncbi:hypothetical protein DOK78_002554 [Enterococcus sp. DIV2402]|uniref:NlpC/P60 domain-containing protein n=1 Tax=Candidatus Enterococcus lowellii TaxID=2230877 RepID=A0ABZ2SVF6_9ENTE|nr:peptidoglycan amidohydrolase family protein [Enterococcus sp. DIV2402]MBO0463329.1 hypothetical protein [Enterococcus sp. DIV2402]
MGDINKMIQWFKDREGKVTYSMTNRLGPNSYDCSSAVYLSLIAGGFLPSGTGIGNTDSLYSLEGTLLTPISRSQVKRGDIFVAGVKGGSGGSGGHTGVFLDNATIIHCTSPKNGIATTPATGWMGDYSGLPVYFYRLPVTAQQPEYYNQTGWYEMLKDDTFYIEKELTNRSGWSMKTGSKIAIDEVVSSGTMKRGKVRLGAYDRYMSLNKTIVKKV